MESYFLLKLVHILSATLLFGTGLGTAFFMWMANRSGNVQAIAITSRHVALADWLFTTPAVVLQPLTGWLLMQRLGMDFGQAWLQLAVIFYLLAGACWLPVVWIQLRLRDIACDAADAGAVSLPPAYHHLMRRWLLLGWPAFTAVALTYWLMIFKPALW
jgi:uncharacterized membrane protein